MEKKQLSDTIAVQSAGTPAHPPQKNLVLEQDTKISAEKLAAKIAYIIENDEINDWDPKSEQKRTYIKEALENIQGQIDRGRCDLSTLGRIILTLSKNNIIDQFNYAWRFEEKHAFLSEMVLGLTMAMEKHLPSTEIISMENLSEVLFSLSTWNFKPNKQFISNVLGKIQSLFDSNSSGKSITHRTALLLLESLRKASYEPNRELKKDFIISIVEIALPYLLSSESIIAEERSCLTAPHLNSNFIRFSGISRLLQKMLVPEHSAYRDRYSAIFKAFASQKINGARAEQLFLAFKQHKTDNLFLQLEGVPKFTESKEGTQITIGHGVTSFMEDEAADKKEATDKKREKENIDYGKLLLFNKHGHPIKEEDWKKALDLAFYKVIYFDLGLLRKHLGLFVGDNRFAFYKGFRWYLKRFSQNIKGYARENGKGHHIFSVAPKFMKDFLTIVRNYACDINNDPDVIGVFALMFKEAVAPYNLRRLEHDPDTLLNILWMNLCLSSAVNNSLAYTPKEQGILFKACQNKLIIDVIKARFLYQIQTMGWNGNVPFSSNVTKAMQAKFKEFKLSSNPSLEEGKWHARILTEAKCAKEALELNHICARTGQEIDIAYLPKKIAIHIDGPSHFNPKTNSKTIKTIFRNITLAKAGWSSIDLNLLLPDAEKEIIFQRILKQLSLDPTLPSQPTQHLMLSAFANTKNKGENRDPKKKMKGTSMLKTYDT